MGHCTYMYIESIVLTKEICVKHSIDFDGKMCFLSRKSTILLCNLTSILPRRLSSFQNKEKFTVGILVLPI